MHSNIANEFIVAACAPRESSHRSGTLDQADQMLRDYPGLASSNIHTAAIVGDDSVVGEFLAADREDSTRKGGPYAWDALTHLCFSRYLRLDRARTPGFVRSAKALLDAGANPNTGWFENDHQPRPEWESAIYGAAGVAHNADLTRLLLEHGADPNDGETPYHVPETYDNQAMIELVGSGKLTDRSMATLLLRKADWHDFEGMKYLLDHGANPNFLTHWNYTALHQALRRDNHLEMIRILLEHGGDPAVANGQDGRSAISIAARRGRKDALDLFRDRGIPLNFAGVERLIAAAARNDAVEARRIAKEDPESLQAVLQEGGALLASFAGSGNTAGVGLLLDLGIRPDALFDEGDPYWDVTPGSTALHVAAWRASHSAVKLLIQRGAPIDRRDGKGRTPLMLAVKACVDSYWMRRRSPESVKALLDAEASRAGVPLPSGYAEIDRLFQT